MVLSLAASSKSVDVDDLWGSRGGSPARRRGDQWRDAAEVRPVLPSHWTCLLAVSNSSEFKQRRLERKLQHHVNFKHSYTEKF